MHVQLILLALISEELREACEDLHDDALSVVLSSCLPFFASDADWPLNDLAQFVQFAGVESRRYRANTRKTEASVERRMGNASVVALRDALVAGRSATSRWHL